MLQWNVHSCLPDTVLLANNWGLVRYGLFYIFHIRILITTKNPLFTGRVPVTNWIGICFISSTAIKVLQSVACEGITLAMLHCMRTIQWSTSSVVCVFVEPDCATPSDSWKVDSPFTVGTKLICYTETLMDWWNHQSRGRVKKHAVASLWTFLVDSSSLSNPESESAGCQIGTLGENFLEAKNKMAAGDIQLIMFWAISSLLSHLEARCWCLALCFQGQGIH